VSEPPTIRFSVFELDLEAGELRRNGSKLRLQEQPFQILVSLLEQPGRVVTRDELRKKLWPVDTFVDFDHGLNAAIGRLREGLNDSAETPRFIETVARRGYRFIAPVDPPRAPTSGAIIISQAEKPKTKLALMLIGLLVLALVLVTYLLKFEPHKTEWNLQTMKVTRVTRSGNATDAAISPDGRFIVYVLQGGGKYSLNVRQVATASDVQILPPDETKIQGLTFSPDGNYVLLPPLRQKQSSPPSSLSDAGARRNIPSSHAGCRRCN
jgi:DNA-binding winged helix-turn-helix (wHTH) protein